MTWRLQLYWQGRRGDDGRHGEQALAFARTFSEAWPPGALAWRWTHPESGARRPLEHPGDWRAALSESAVRWRCGARTVESYVLNAYAEREGAKILDCKLTLGVRLEELPGLFLPNQAKVLVHRAVGDADAVTATLWAALCSAVSAFDPDWGHCGTEEVPTEALPMFDDGAPLPGWWTYLSTRAGGELALAPPAVMHSVVGMGVLVVAHPKLFNPRSEEHVRAVEAVRDAMESAGLLVPAEPER